MEKPKTYSDVWSSNDGKTWTEKKTVKTKWSARRNYASVVFKDKDFRRLQFYQC